MTNAENPTEEASTTDKAAAADTPAPEAVNTIQSEAEAPGIQPNLLARRLAFTLAGLGILIVVLLIYWGLRVGMASDVSSLFSAQLSERMAFEKEMSKQLAESNRQFASLKESYDQIQKNTRSDREAIDQYLRRSVSPGALDQVLANIRELQAGLNALRSEITSQKNNQATQEMRVNELHTYLSEQLYPVLVELQNKTALQDAELHKIQQTGSEPALTGVSIAPDEAGSLPKAASSQVTVQPGATMPVRPATKTNEQK